MISGKFQQDSEMRINLGADNSFTDNHHISLVVIILYCVWIWKVGENHFEDLYLNKNFLLLEKKKLATREKAFSLSYYGEPREPIPAIYKK